MEPTQTSIDILGYIGKMIDNFFLYDFRIINYQN